MEKKLSAIVLDFRTKALGKTQPQFAELVGVSVNTILNIEKGAKPSLKTYEKLAKAMGIPSKALRVLATDSKESENE